MSTSSSFLGMLSSIFLKFIYLIFEKERFTNQDVLKFVVNIYFTDTTIYENYS